MSTIVTPKAEIGRDRYGRPLVVPPNGGKPTAYTRCTTFIDCIEDKFNLDLWKQRMVALGLAGRTDLLLAVQAHREDKKQLNRICDDAREAAAATAAATTGTALHALTEVIDSGGTLPALPAGASASLEAYREATKPLTMLEMEKFVVLDTLKVSGTFDRLVEFEGETYVADLKTSQTLDFGTLKHAMQLAIYSRSCGYDIATGERTPLGASMSRGILIHCPSTDDPAEARAELHWVDLERGWDAVLVAKQVRAQRSIKKADVLSTFGSPARHSIGREKADVAKAEKEADRIEDRIARMIAAASTADEVRAIWADHESDWSDALTETARKHIAGLSNVA